MDACWLYADQAAVLLSMAGVQTVKRKQLMHANAAVPQHSSTPGLLHKCGGNWVSAEASACCPLGSSLLQRLAPAVPAVDAAVVEHQHHHRQLVPARDAHAGRCGIMGCGCGVQQEMAAAGRTPVVWFMPAGSLMTQR